MILSHAISLSTLLRDTTGVLRGVARAIACLTPAVPSLRSRAGSGGAADPGRAATALSRLRPGQDGLDLQWRHERRIERQERFRLGHTAEWFAAVSLLIRGYRIVARRYKTKVGEIDLIAVRGSVVAFVEVKARRTLADAEVSISPRQSRRIRQAAAFWIARQRRYQSFEQRFDALYILPRRWPIHLPGEA